jgi:predicted nucleic acid-binding protein
MLVVDASVAVKWFIQQKASEEARALAGPHSVLLAPELVLAEIANALWKYVRSDRVKSEDARIMLARAPAAFTQLTPLSEIALPAFDLAASLNHPVYDCCYIALARREAAPLVTADKRLAHAAQASGIEVRLIG